MTQRKGQHNYITVRDLGAPTSGHQSSLKVFAPSISPDEVVLEGRFRRDQLRAGLSLHVSDVIEHHGFATQWLQPAGLSCIFFLEGQIDVAIGNQSVRIGRSRNNPIKGLAINRTEDEMFRRQSHDGQKVKQAVITFTPEWLDIDGLQLIGDHRSASKLISEHLKFRSWPVSANLARLLEQVILPSGLGPVLEALYLESRTIEIICESLLSLTRLDGAPRAPNMDRNSHARIARVLAFIEAHLDDGLTIERIAREGGVSPSVLQRLFRASKGCSVFEYVRQRNLERARVALQSDRISIQAAALLAGYSSAGNFSTAFKRSFGISPSQARQTTFRS